MKEHIDRLIQDAEVLRKDFLTGWRYSWYRYSPRHAGYARWKQRVLQVVSSLGEYNPYYSELLAIEKECSATRPQTVFAAFLQTLKQVPNVPEGLSWPKPTAQASETISSAAASAAVEPEIVKEEPEPVRAAVVTAAASDSIRPPAAQAEEALPPAEAPVISESPGEMAAAASPLKNRLPGGEICTEKSFQQYEQEAREAYARLLAGVTGLLEWAEAPGSKEYAEIYCLCELSLKTLRANPALICCAANISTGNYLYAHTVNVTIFSQALALDQGLPDKDTMLLSFCALTHDLGMTGFRELYSKKGGLSDPEFSRVALHVDTGIEKLGQIEGMDRSAKKRAAAVLRQVHERFDASGYPLRASGMEIDPLAQIIGVADVYEAMTHPRAWREACHQSAAMRFFIEEEGKRFGLQAIRSLLRSLSVYPPGSLVMLSSGEVARVVMPRKETLTRPVVEVLLGPYFEPVRPVLLDLSEHLVRYSIERPVYIYELEDRNPQFAARFRSALFPEADVEGPPSDKPGEEL